MLANVAPGVISLWTSLLVWAIIIHLVADWPLQTEWMAMHKSNLAHPAAWAHSGVHAALLLLVFPWPLAAGVGITNLLIDTRRPVTWWMVNVKRMPRSASCYAEVEMWMDQVFHIVVLALMVLLFVR